MTTLLFWECRRSCVFASQIIWLFLKMKHRSVDRTSSFPEKSGTREARAAALWVRDEVKSGPLLQKLFQLLFSVTSSHRALFSPLLNERDFKSNNFDDPP